MKSASGNQKATPARNQANAAPPVAASRQQPASSVVNVGVPGGANSDSDVPELVGSSDEEGDYEDVTRPSVPPVAKPVSKPEPPLARETDSDSSDNDSADHTQTNQAKKKKKSKKKKKPKKKATGELESADGVAQASANQPAEAAPATAPQPGEPAAAKPTAPAPTVSAERAAQIAAEKAAALAEEVEFRNKWKTVLDTISDLLKKARLKSKSEQLRFSWAVQKFHYDVVVENTEEERRHQALTADALAATQGQALEDPLDEADMYADAPELRSADDAASVGEDGTEEALLAADAMPAVDPAQCTPVDLSIAVKKWLERADEKYRAMFQCRVAQLASGQRSYALSKRLKHCSVPIYETKLDKGQRLLWSQILRKRSEDSTSEVTLMVWFAAKHDHVPQLLRLIEHSCGRTIRQVEGRGRAIADSSQLSQVTARYISSADPTSRTLPALSLPDEAVLLDPQGNIPLKLYPVPDLHQLSRPNWRAPLRLNRLELSVRSKSGTVLLLGRSGTGKTLCLMDRMQHDRAQLQHQWLRDCAAAGGASGPVAPRRPSQLFVARSAQLCELVRRYQPHSAMDSAGEDVLNDFMRMRRFQSEMERRIALAESPGKSTPGEASAALFHQTHRVVDCVDFARFQKEVYPVISERLSTANPRASSNGATDPTVGAGGGAAGAAATGPLDPLIAWTQIRSFLKGSVEAVLAGGVLPLKAYLDAKAFSKDRCRLLESQRRQAYELFERYQRHLADHRLWDEMDRINHILRRALAVHGAYSAHSGTVDAAVALQCGSWEPFFNKVYVDEVQDYTQAEIALFLLAVGFRTDSLFLAGDPAQSVVEGVDFRFEEVRSLVYQLTAGRESVQRPIKLLTNYRSHDGVLACAAAIIDKLLLMFPGSANVLTKDEGVFSGPRPNYCLVTDPLELLTVLGTGVAVLTPDTSHWLKRRAESSISSGTGTGTGTGVKDIRDWVSGMALQDVSAAGEGGGDSDVEEGAGTTAPTLQQPVSVDPTATKGTADLLSLGNTVMGIRAAKGLEFSDVVVLDFFASQSGDTRAWKVLFADNAEVQVQDQQYSHPQLEPQLKMLYTAITRAMNRLLFVETRQTPAGDAFFRWLERRKLADRFDLAAAKAQGEARYITSDEWKVRGIQLALQADTLAGSGASAQAVDDMLASAVRCFTSAADTQLRAVAQTQRRLLQLVAACRSEGAVPSGADKVLLEGLQCGLLDEVRDACAALLEAQPQGSHWARLVETELLGRTAELCDLCGSSG